MTTPLTLHDSAIFESHFVLTDLNKLPDNISDKKKVIIGEKAFNIQAESGEAVDRKNCYVCQVTVETKKGHGDLFFNLKIVMKGVFEVSESFYKKPDADVDKLILITGASMLYSAIREYVLIITARAPTPAIQLPVVTFSPNIKKKGAKVGAEAAPESQPVPT